LTLVADQPGATPESTDVAQLDAQPDLADVDQSGTSPEVVVADEPVVGRDSSVVDEAVVPSERGPVKPREPPTWFLGMVALVVAGFGYFLYVAVPDPSRSTHTHSQASSNSSSPPRPRVISAFGMDLKDWTLDGVRVDDVDPESTAATKNIHGGDSVLEINHEKVETLEDIESKIANLNNLGSKSALLTIANSQGGRRFVRLGLQ
jgi:membrane-associated protease RseP (regulator of RpoE activity)